MMRIWILLLMQCQLRTIGKVMKLLGRVIKDSLCMLSGRVSTIVQKLLTEYKLFWKLIKRGNLLENSHWCILRPELQQSYVLSQEYSMASIGRLSKLLLRNQPTNVDKNSDRFYPKYQFSLRLVHMNVNSYVTFWKKRVTKQDNTL
jgi:hypothetical protein